MKGTLLKAAVRKALDSLGTPARGETLVVGLSGGADSVALLDALADVSREQGFALVAAHLDHGLREDSRDDAAFCEDLCRRLRVPLVVARADVRARSRRERNGIEDAARAERYAFLDPAAKAAHRPAPNR